ncbi:Alpha-ketoglutarate permease [Cupriavidus yeoncheonensis]|uniref:Alpha-ketoglutarate permease n=1 Tax=Cupriavidus yeoncheonensis TaxID=1462994 RepID=A0A916IQ88_9BURK|nr:MFS transporter [Cupriavidus yeoncheonensis]CAG2133997.1 Alpha-ketoglutarate permease [Cupriavidus yeoncheonensis]
MPASTLIDTGHPPAPAAARPVIGRAAVAAAVAGNALEFYDFVIYAYFAVYIGRAFFPVGGEFGSLLLSAATFGVGFFTRPLGAILIGALADRAGRKPAMILTVALITVGTLGMAATPSYASIGIAAPLIVVACRLLQGLALGGEVGPATALLVEAAPPNQRALYASWQLASQGIAVAVGGLLGVAVSLVLTAEQLAAWGWRVPFLVSIVLVPVAVKIRRSLPETFEAGTSQSTGEILGGVVRRYRSYLILGVLMTLAGAVSSQIGNYMTTYAIQTLHLPPTLAQTSALAGGAITFAFALLGGWLCDRRGRKIVLVLPRVLLMLLIVPMFSWLISAPSAFSFLAVTAVIAALTAMSAAAAMVVIPELLPASFRSTGISLVYAVGTTLFGGTTQFAVTGLLAWTGNPMSPAWYLAVTSLVSLVAMWMLPETRDVEI